MVGRVFGQLLGRLEVLGEAGMARDMEYDWRLTRRLGVVELEHGRGRVFRGDACTCICVVIGRCTLHGLTLLPFEGS